MLHLFYRYSVILVTGVICSLLYNAVAIGATMTVTDPTLEQTTQNMYNFMQNDMHHQMSSINSAVQTQANILKQSLSGIGSTNSIFNTPTNQSFRNWTPSAEDLQNMIKEGLQTGSLADQIKYYNQKFPIPTAHQLNPDNPDSPLAQYGNFAAVNTNAAFSIADKSFDNVRTINQQLSYLYSLIDRPQTLKDGLDINSAILVQIASLQTELMRLQSQQLKMQAVSQQENNNNRLLMSSFIENIE